MEIDTKTGTIYYNRHKIVAGTISVINCKTSMYTLLKKTNMLFTRNKRP
jgi:hypothetical protein